MVCILDIVPHKDYTNGVFDCFAYRCDWDFAYCFRRCSRQSTDSTTVHRRFVSKQTGKGNGGLCRGLFLGRSVRVSTREGCSRSEEHTSELQSPCNLVC